MSILITCETGGNQIPPGLRGGQVSVSPDGQIGDQRGFDQSSFDPRALDAARVLSDALACPFIANPYSLCWIDVSRSLRNRDLYSAAVRRLPQSQKDDLVQSVYRPYRMRIRQAILACLARHPWCVHVSVRTFAPVASGNYRRADAGVAYDTNSFAETAFCADWVDDMYTKLEMLKVRRNYPRRGSVDSLHRAMRQKFASDGYLGIELQLNRAWVGRNVAIRGQVLSGIADTLTYLTSDSAFAAA